VYVSAVKPTLDRFFALLGLIILSPLFLLLGILIRVSMGSPILFIQERIGLDEKRFNLFKFRTMTNQLDKSGTLLPDAKRLTKVGKFLRSTSLDELPELVNILDGSMSFVGPRPLLIDYLPLYNDRQRRRHSVKPGITGWAQIKGRNELSWPERFELDLWYVENMSFFTDVKILFKTIAVVLTREGISSETSVTMERFSGNDDE
jgi:undecaprenyl phosphate N,N'-diacetylbacillosamine 1-phosphate transferase